MNNPFMKDGYMLPVASINSVYIDDQLVGDLFRLELIIKDIVAHQEELGLSKTSDPKSIFEGLKDALLSEDDQQKEMAYQIAHKYGTRLANLLKTLKKPSASSIEHRKNWTKEHWDYWKTIKKLVFVGGVSLPSLTKIFLEDIQKMLDKEQLNLEVSFIEGSVNLGTEALSKTIESGDALLFDFGQTNIKRRHHSKDKDHVVFDMILPCIPSKYLDYKTQSEEALKKRAILLDAYIQKVILDTMEETLFDGEMVHIAMANYIYEGRIYPGRGGYAKLGLLFDQYDDHLSSQLSMRVGRKIKVRLFHDTTAVSYFFEGEEKTAVMSIGTAFGIAFVDGERNA
jgi:hypothetical protein